MLSAALLLLATYVADVGPISGQPVELDTCSYVHNMAQTRYGHRVSYMNTSDVAADMIRIHVYWHGLGEDQYLRDVGKFTSNVEVSHTFPAPQIFASGLTCAVESVHFVEVLDLEGADRTAVKDSETSSGAGEFPNSDANDQRAL